MQNSEVILYVNKTRISMIMTKNRFIQKLCTIVAKDSYTLRNFLFNSKSSQWKVGQNLYKFQKINEIFTSKRFFTKQFPFKIFRAGIFSYLCYEVWQFLFVYAPRRWGITSK